MCFVGGVAIIRGWGHRSGEVKEKKDRVEDAMHATRAAVEEGIVPGGGTALLCPHGAGKSLPPTKTRRWASALSGARWNPRCARLWRERRCRRVHRCWQAAGEEDFSYGFNAWDMGHVDMFKAGIVDPTKVVRTALQDAASVAGLLITTECMVAEKPEKKPAGRGIPGGGMGGMDF